MTLGLLRARFSLRALLLGMTGVCCLVAALAYEFQWIRERQAFRRQSDSSCVEQGTPQPVAPQLLSLFGERGVGFITTQVFEDDWEYSSDGGRKLKPAARKKVLRAHELFPEATIFAMDESGDVAENLSAVWESPQ